MFEHKNEELLSRQAFLLRMGKSGLAVLGIAGMSLGIGACGYHYLEGLEWVDSLLNASMILTGMGPVSELRSTSGKLFATFYSLYSGIAFLTIMAVFLAPLVHRGLHHFHLDDEDEQGS